MTAAPPEAIWRIVYFGSPAVAVPPLRALSAAGYRIDLVVTQPPRRRTRRGKPAPTPVAAAAHQMGLPVAVGLEDEAVLAAAAGADLGVVVAYGRLIGAALLDRLPMVNLHYSLLPRWRGAAPVERAILAGDEETGVCLMEVSPELDAGAVYRRAVTPIGALETAAELRDRLCDLGVEMLLGALAEGLGEPVPQSGSVTRADKIEPEELRIDWAASAERIHRLVRVGGAWTTFRGRRLKILEARRHPAPPADAGSAGEARPGDAALACSIKAAANSAPAELFPRAGGADVAGGRDANSASGELLTGESAKVPGGGLLVVTGEGLLNLLRVQAAGRPAAPAASWRNGARIGPGERLGR